jgi:heme exporter protein D
MNWGSASEFLAMGGYGAFVWGSYGVTVVLIVAEIVSLRARRRRALQDVQRQAAAGANARE